MSALFKKYSFFILGIICARNLGIEGEADCNEDIYHFAMPQEMLTPSFSLIRSTDFSDLRVDFSIELYQGT